MLAMEEDEGENLDLVFSALDLCRADWEYRDFSLSSPVAGSSSSSVLKLSSTSFSLSIRLITLEGAKLGLVLEGCWNDLVKVEVGIILGSLKESEDLVP